MTKEQLTSPTTSPTAKLALAARRAHLQRRRILGITGKNDPNANHVLLEAAQKAADCVNYLTFAGENELAERVVKVGDAIAKLILSPHKAPRKALKT